MRRPIHLELGILAFVSAAFMVALPSSAHRKDSACGLLTAQEIENAFGVKPEPALDHEEVAEKAPWKGETLRRCNWPLGKGGSAGNVYLSVGVTKTDEQRKASLAQVDQMVDQFRARGWPVEKSVLGKVTCVVGTPPPAQKLASVIHCFTEDKGRGVAVSPTLTNIKASANTVKALAEKAIGRLP